MNTPLHNASKAASHTSVDTVHTSSHTFYRELFPIIRTPLPCSLTRQAAR